MREMARRMQSLLCLAGRKWHRNHLRHLRLQGGLLNPLRLDSRIALHCLHLLQVLLDVLVEGLEVLHVLVEVPITLSWPMLFTSLAFKKNKPSR